MTGRIGSDYEILRELRRGPWVTVYEARHRILGRRTLVKWLNPEHKGDDEMTGRLRREATLGSKIDHPNAARIHDIGEAGGRPYVAIEWIEGEDLETVLERDGLFSVPRALRLARDLLNGLVAIHEAGVVHRDLSPANVRITATGLARITDFGLATGRFDPRFTLPGSVVGTPGYLAPEQASGKEIDSRADLFATGVLLHETLTGHTLFRDKDLIATLKRVRNEPAPSLDDMVDNLPEGFAGWVARLLEKNPDDRWQSAKEADEALDDLVTEREEDAEVPEKTRKRSYWFTIPATLLPAVVIALLIATVIQVLRPTPPSPIEPPSLVPGARKDSTDKTVVESTTQDSLKWITDRQSVTTGEGKNREDRIEPDFTEVRTTDTQDNAKIDRKQAETETPETYPASRSNEILVEKEKVSAGTGILTIQTRPWADVYLDQERIGATPGIDPLKLPAGEIHLIFDNPGFPPIPFDTIISTAGTTRVFLELAQMVGTVSISATPWARVYVDDNPLGETPLGRLIHLAPGQHTVRMTHPEFGEKTREINLKQGETATIHIDMTK